MDSDDTLCKVITEAKVRKKKKTKGKIDMSKAGKEEIDMSNASKKEIDVSKAGKEKVNMSKAGKEKCDVSEAGNTSSDSKDILGRIITVSKVKKEKKKTKGKSDVVTEAGKKLEDNNVAKVKMAAMEDDSHECSIKPITDTSVKKTILCKSDWAKIASTARC